jgi:hypothetical protein
MKAQELRIGDRVLYCGREVVIESIHPDGINIEITMASENTPAIVCMQWKDLEPLPPKRPVTHSKEMADLLRRHPKDMVVIAGAGEFLHYKLEEFIAQPAELILYDLNRDAATCLTLLEGTGDLVWVNNYATGQVIRALKEKIAELEERIGGSIEP